MVLKDVTKNLEKLFVLKEMSGIARKSERSVNVTFNPIVKDDLIQMKLASERPQDNRRCTKFKVKKMRFVPKIKQ